MTNAERNQALTIFIDDENREKVQRQFEGALGQEQQKRLYRAFVEDTILNCLKLPSVTVRVCCTKGSTAKLVNDVVAKLEDSLVPNQKRLLRSSSFGVFESSGGTMRKRLAGCFRSAFEAGHSSVALIGCVTPTLSKQVILNAFDLMKKLDLVIGPTHEGSYYLLAMSRHIPELLDEANWEAGGQVYSQLVKVCRNRSFTWQELDLWYDLRNPEDLEFLVTDINHFRLVGDEDSAARTESVLEEILKDLPG